MAKAKLKTEIIAAVLFLTALIAFTLIFSAVTIPKRVEYGANWGPFLQEERGSIDIMFFGSSVVYCDVVPNRITELTGRSAYVLAGPEQTIPMTYYYIKEMYQSQNPTDIFVDVTAMFFPRYTDFTKANVGYMPWSISRIEATFKAAETEERFGLLFPPFNYHDRWNELTLGDLKPYSRDPERGYTKLTEANDVGEIEIRTVDFDEESYEYSLSYLGKIKELCEKKGSRLNFYIAPAYGRWEPEYLEKLKKDMTAQGLALTDFNDIYDEIGIDADTDYFDFLHFNYDGAIKFTSFLTERFLG